MQLAFGDCELDLARRELRRDGTVVHIRAKVFEVLSYLIANRDRVVNRDDLMAHAWPGLTVSDTTLSTCILAVRRAIGDDVNEPRFVKTLRGQGFRFIADVAVLEDADVAPRPGDAVHAREDSLSIAVLPFANLNNDPELDHLADGLAEDIITALSRFKAFTVIARNSSFLYRGLANDIQKIGAELRVDYVLEGSVRQAGGVLRVAAQLIHAATAKHLWAERFDGRIDDLLSLQDDISRRIVTNIGPEIDQEEIRRAAGLPAGDLRAQEMAWRARALIDRARAEGDAALALEGMVLAEAAAEHDPQCRQAWWTITFVNYTRAFAGHGPDQSALLKRAREAAEKLRALDRNDHSAYMSLGWISYIEQDFERAMSYLDQALTLNPNCTMTLMLTGVIAMRNGSPEAGYDYLAQAMRLSPRDTFLGFMLAAQAVICYALSRFDEGVDLARRAIQREPHAPANHAILAACLVETGAVAQAGAAIRAQRRINDTLLRLYLEGKRLPFKGAQLNDRYVAALHRAAEAADGSAHDVG